MIGTAPTVPPDLLGQLVDIRGLGKIISWPLAPGWWVLIALSCLLLLIGITLILRRRAWRRSWKSEADQALSQLETNLGAKNAQATAAALSVTLRRIAMRKFSRPDCAGLEGERWLQWLKQNDPRGFDWLQAGNLLTNVPYAPPDPHLQPAMVKPLLHAAREWVK